MYSNIREGVKPFLDFIKNKTLLMIRLRLSIIFLHRKSKFPHTLCREKLTVNCIVPKPALLHGGGSLNAHQMCIIYEI